MNLPALGKMTDTHFIRRKDPRLPPNMPFVEQAGQIASPITPCQPKALVQKFWVVFQCRLNFALWVVLHIRLPAVRHHPASDEIVVISVELILAEPPFLVGKALCELLVLQDVRTVGYRTA